MRYVIIIIILIAIIQANAQSGNSKPQPFQVLYAENTKNKSGTDIKSLDLICIDDTLRIQNGTLSLIHYTGFPLEINSDTIIEIQKLHELIIDRDSKRKSKKRKSYAIYGRPNLELLFILDKMQANIHKLSNYGSCMDCGPNVIYPPERIVHYKNDLCLKWENKSGNSTRVTISTMSNEILKDFTVDNNEISLDSTELNTLKGKTKETILLLSLKIDFEKSQTDIVIKKSKKNLETPYSCSPRKATFALMAALYNEQPRFKSLADAERYYVLVAQLSDRKFYSDMLANFRKRNGK